jgi:hypothetical protein
MEKVEDQRKTLEQIHSELNEILDHKEGQIDTDVLSAKVDEICKIASVDTLTADDVEDRAV